MTTLIASAMAVTGFYASQAQQNTTLIWQTKGQNTLKYFGWLYFDYYQQGIYSNYQDVLGNQFEVVVSGSASNLTFTTWTVNYAAGDCATVPGQNTTQVKQIKDRFNFLQNF